MPHNSTINNIKVINSKIIIQTRITIMLLMIFWVLLPGRPKKYLINIPLQPLMFHYSYNSTNNHQFI